MMWAGRKFYSDELQDKRYKKKWWRVRNAQDFYNLISASEYAIAAFFFMFYLSAAMLSFLSTTALLPIILVVVSSLEVIKAFTKLFQILNNKGRKNIHYLDWMNLLVDIFNSAVVLTVTISFLSTGIFLGFLHAPGLIVAALTINWLQTAFELWRYSSNYHRAKNLYRQGKVDEAEVLYWQELMTNSFYKLGTLTLIGVAATAFLLGIVPAFYAVVAVGLVAAIAYSNSIHLDHKAGFTSTFFEKLIKPAALFAVFYGFALLMAYAVFPVGITLTLLALAATVGYVLRQMGKPSVQEPQLLPDKPAADEVVMDPGAKADGKIHYDHNFEPAPAPLDLNTRLLQYQSELRQKHAILDTEIKEAFPQSDHTKNPQYGKRHNKKQGIAKLLSAFTAAGSGQQASSAPAYASSSHSSVADSKGLKGQLAAAIAEIETQQDGQGRPLYSNFDQSFWSVKGECRELLDRGKHLAEELEREEQRSIVQVR